MNKLKSLLILIVIGLFFVSSVADADARPSFNPKGWSKGKKTGWHGESTPPGFSKKEAKKAEKEAKKAEKETKRKAKEAEKATKKPAKI